jgi:hypothetical protein
MAVSVSALVALVATTVGGASARATDVRRVGSSFSPISSGLAQPSKGVVGSGSSLAATIESATAGLQLTKPVVGMAGTVSGHGFWLVASDGGIFSFGDAKFMGSTGGTKLNRPIVGIAATASGKGYWLVASDGGIFSFGDARFFGSTGGIALNRPIVGIGATPSGAGYWLVASDGGMFSFGDARFHGSTGSVALRQPITAMASTPTGQGYWLVASDGGMFSFGDAAFSGSSSGKSVTPVVGMAPTNSGHGYWLSAADGSVYSFGNASTGTSAASLLGQPVVGIAASRAGGYWLVGVNGATLSMAAPAVATGIINPPAGGNPGSYTFLAANGDGSPIRYNPCAPVHYVTNLAHAPASAGSDIQGALARVSAATGMTFINDGSTTEVPTKNRASSQARYGKGWAPVLIGWASPNSSDLLPGGSIVGEGGSSWVQQGAAPAVFVTGEVGVDQASTASIPSGFGGGVTMGELLLHELGHVVGMGHTTDNSQIMYPDLQTRSSANYGAGDNTGLHRLGTASGCLTTPSSH